VADVVRLEDVDQALVLRRVIFELRELVACRAEGAGRWVAQRADRGRGLLARVDQVLGQGADDAVPACVYLGDAILVLAARLDDAAGGGVDHSGDAAGLGIEGIAGLGCGHWETLFFGQFGVPRAGRGRIAQTLMPVGPRPVFL